MERRKRQGGGGREGEKEWKVNERREQGRTAGDWEVERAG